MKNIFLLLTGMVFFTACDKNKFNTVPEIKYKSVKPNFFFAGGTTTNPDAFPKITIKVTDAEGDFGFIRDQDTSRVYIKNLLSGKEDSVDFPSLQSAAAKNFEAEVDISIERVLQGSTRPAPKTDTLFFEIFVRDFARNKSNVIKTGDPIFYIFR
jgi:hypothetical protein